MKKNLQQVLIAIAAIGSTVVLAHFMRMHSLAFAWALNFLLMFWVFVFTETQTSELTSPYYTSKTWERKGQLYEYCGINLFRKLLVLIGWEKLNKKSNPVEKSAKALAHNLLRTKKSELGHLIIFFIVLGVSVVVIVNSGLRNAVWLITFNIILNLYPVLLQRYNRPRIERALQLIQRNELRMQNKSTNLQNK
jgi:Flp pilus assembly protein TadB